MKHIFAKIIEMPDHQVLVTKGIDDDGSPVIKVSTRVAGVDPCATFGFADKEAVDNAFDGFGQEDATMFLNGVAQMLGNQ